MDLIRKKEERPRTQGLKVSYYLKPRSATGDVRAHTGRMRRDTLAIQPRVAVVTITTNNHNTAGSRLK